MKRVLLALGIALILQSGMVQAKYVNDTANVIGNEAAIERIIQDFYNEYDIIIILETVDNATDIKELAEKRFSELGLDDKGTKELNTLILYSNKTREINIAHSKRCSLESSKIMEIFKMEEVIGEINKGNYDEGFLNAVKLLIEKLKEKSKDRSCSLPVSMYFGVDEAIYDPPSPDNPYGRSLNRKLNPYDDGIVTVNDPLVCRISRAGDLKEVEFTLEWSSGNVKRMTECDKGICTYKIGRIGYRGEKVTCSVNIDGQKISKDIVIARYVFIFFPLNQKSLGDAKEEYEFFLEISEANTKPEYSVKPIYLDVPIEKEFYHDMEPLKDAAIEVCNRIYEGDISEDRFIAVTDDVLKFDAEGFAYFDSYALCISGKEKQTLAHELGHSMSNLCDEYKPYIWKTQNMMIYGGCPNQFSECYYIIPQDSPDSCKVVIESEGDLDIYCTGMPYLDENTPSPQSKVNARYYSIMGFSSLVERYSILGIPLYNKYTPLDVIYPVEATCPLRNCE
jgi:hypothetical protein